MTVPPLWPVDMPLCADVRTNSGEMQDQVHRFRPEQGLPITRAMQTAPMMQFSLGFAGLTEVQMAAFYTFYSDVLMLGAIPFAWVHPRRHIPREVTFAGPPRETRLGANAWSLAIDVTFVEIDPGWAGEVTVANGYLELI